MTSSHLAQVNLARLRFPLDAKPLAEFVAALDRTNALADKAPGFIWRHRSDDRGHVSIADTTGDPLLIINLSVWRTYQQLHDFTYRSTHMHYLRRRNEWFDKMQTPATALWWIPDGHRPTQTQAIARPEHLRSYGPTPQAFTVRSRFDSAGRRETRPQQGFPSALQVHQGCPVTYTQLVVGGFVGTEHLRALGCPHNDGDLIRMRGWRAQTGR